MPRIRNYDRSRDPAEEARKAAAANFQQQRQAQASAYAAAKFNEWAAGAQDREALMNARLQNQQSEAELKGAQFRYNFWKDNELRRQTTAYYTAMPALQEQLKQNGIYPGSARYAAEMSAFAAELPDAVTHNEAIRKDLEGYAKVDEDAARIQKMMVEQGMSKQQAQMTSLTQDLASQNQIPKSFSTSAKGVDVKSSGPSDEDLKSLKLTPTEFLNHVNAKQGKFDESGKFTQGLAPGEQANAIQFQAGTSKDKATSGQIVTHNIPLEQFNQIRSGLGVEPLPAYSAPAQQVAPQAAPSATPNLSDLAQRALNDPNATDEHKAKARQILGIQEENAQ